MFEKSKSTAWVAGLAICVLSAMPHAVEAANKSKKKAISFKELKLESPYNITHPVMAANIHPQSGTELVTFTADDEQNKYLIVYGYNEKSQNYEVIDEILLDKSFLKFDISEASDKELVDGAEMPLQGLYLMSSQRLVKYQGEAKSAFERLATVMEVNSLFLKDDPQFISRGNFIKNINDDQFEDFIIPDFSGAHVFVGKSGLTAEKTTLPIKPQVLIFDDGANYTQSQLFIADVNLDKKLDVVRVGEGEIFAFLQNEAGNFEQSPFILPIESTISGVDWWDKRDSNGESLDQSDLKYRKIEDLRDVNNDGTTDMVVRYTQSSGVLDKVNDYEVYLGENQQGQLVFSDKPNSTIKADGTLTGLEFVDIDNDQKYEVLLSGFDIGLAEIIGALLAGSIDQNVFLFKMDSKGNYGRKPNISREVELNFSLTKGQSGSAVVKLADVNGDNLKDLILSKGDDTLKIYLGRKGDKSFSSRSVSYKTNLPKDGNTLFTQDLNNDGKEDILMKFSSLDDEKLARQFKVLLAQ